MKSYSFDITLQYASQFFLSTKLCHIISINAQNKFWSVHIALVQLHFVVKNSRKILCTLYVIIQEHTDNALTNQNKNTTTFLPIVHVCSINYVLVSTVWHVFQSFMTSLAGCFSYLMSFFKITPKQNKIML